MESEHRRQTNPQPLFDLFRRSYMNTPTREVGVRLKIVYLAKRKTWQLQKGIGPWRDPLPNPNNLLCTEQTEEGEIRPGFYIRVESGMSETSHRRILIGLYRTRYTPNHPKWQEWAVQGTLREHCDSIVKVGLICGGVTRLDASKRSEIHLANRLVASAKTHE